MERVREIYPYSRSYNIQSTAWNLLGLEAAPLHWKLYLFVV